MSTTALPNQVFVAKIDFQLDYATTETHYVSTAGFSSLPTDTPPNEFFPARIKHPGTYRQEVFTSSRLTGAVRPAFGELVLFNDDGVYDSWIGLGTAGGKVTVSLGTVGAAYPAGYSTILVAYIANVVADFNEVRLRLRDRSYLLDKPAVSDTFTGTGDLDGPADFSAKKALCILDPGYIVPLLVDYTNNIYFVQANAVDDLAVAGSSAFFTLLEAGVPITRGANYASEYDLKFVPPSAGEVRFYFGPSGSSGHYFGPVFFRLGTAATGELRINPAGYVYDLDDPIHDLAPGAYTLTSLCRRAGLSDVTQATMATGLNTDLQVAPQYVDDARTYLDLMQASAFSDQSFFGFDREDKFFCGRLGLPSGLEGGETYQANFELGMMANIRRSYLVDMQGPVYQTTVNTGKTWPVGTLNVAVEPEVRELLTRRPWFNSLTATSDPVRYANQNAVATVLNTSAKYLSTSLSAILSRYMALYAGARDVLTFTVPFTAAFRALKINDPIQITIPRFDCDSGRFFRICALLWDLAARTITISAWGGEIASSSFVLGGGVQGDGPPTQAVRAPGGVFVVRASVVPDGVGWTTPPHSGTGGGSTFSLVVSVQPGPAFYVGGRCQNQESFIVAASDTCTQITVGVNKQIFRMPFNLVIQDVKVSVSSAPSGSSAIFNVRRATGSPSSIFATRPSIDAGELTSRTAATPPVLGGDTYCVEDEEMAIDFDQVGSTLGGIGVKVTFYVVRV